ncbi:MAG TPA: alpha-amylase family glycosyl hydrolase [Pseudolabrys sp.]|nr:alpha-amylase family glycosyl hydrolase [Pseudolabrys sp.]
MDETEKDQPRWWQRGIVYQVYPRSFQDTNGDGVGDLTGIRRRLDYLEGLGVDAVWISPIYPSPMADFGYDVADYCGVDPLFGTLADFDALVADAHGRGLKVILDFVPNHTSNRHPWFLDSRSSRQSPKRDWYIWRDGKRDGSPPNNWISHFGGPAWAFDETTGQWYLHSFLRQQPDLNWRNPEVRRAMYDALRFWLRRGVDGFRVDVIWLLIKDEKFRDNPLNPSWQPPGAEIGKTIQLYNSDRPEVHEVIAEMRAVLDEFDERVLIGEIYLPLERLVTYYGKELKGAQLPFNFQLLETAWDARAIAKAIEDYERLLPAGGWPNWVLGNHDRPRIAARVGSAQARVAAMLLLTLRGTPTMYYGDEIGLARVEIPPGAGQDPWEKNEPGHGRDASRTPMQWDASALAGFTTAQTPWLPLDRDHERQNVAVLGEVPDSILNLYRALIALRRAHRALAGGAFRMLAVTDATIVFERTIGGERLIVALNLGGDAQPLPPFVQGAGIVLSTMMDRGGRIEEATLRGDEGLVLRPPA